MASSTQTVVGKGIQNLLIVENLLKILTDLIPSLPPKSPTNSHPWNGRITEGCIHFLNEMNHRSELSCLKLTSLTVKPFQYPWQILLISPIGQTSLAILFNRMTSPLKLLLYSNTSDCKWIHVKLTLHLWQVTFTNTQVEKLSRSLRKKPPSNFPARNLVVKLMITSDNFLGNNHLLLNPHRVLYVTFMITSDILENANSL